MKPFNFNFQISLIYNKYKVNDAKVLSWLVDKRFSRMLVGNEIDKIDEDI